MPTLDELLGGVPSYFFANRPSGPGSYSELESRRKIAQAMLAKRSPFPQNVGQGLTYLGEKIGDVAMLRDINRRDAEDQARQEQEGRDYRKGLERASSPAGPSAPPTPTSPAVGSQPPLEPDNSASEPAALTPAVAITPPTDPRDAIALAAMPSFTAASGERPAPMPSAPAIDRGGLPTGVPMPPPRPVYDRNRQIAELQANPALEQRMLTIAKGEVGNNPRAQQLIAETIMNRAAARDQPLEQVMRQYTGPRSSGYYPPETFGMGRASPDILTPVLRGSDEGGQALGFAPTGNASGGVAARGVASGRYNAAGRLPGSAETFVQQERPEQLARLAGTRLGPGASATDTIGSALFSEADLSPSPAPTEGGGEGGGGGGGGPSGNPPIITDIPPAPSASVAQLRPGGGSAPGALPGPFDPRQPEPTPQSAGGIVQQQPNFTLPPAPVEQPMGPQEIDAMVRARASRDPLSQGRWLELANVYKTQRDQDLARRKTEWDSLVRSREAAKLEADKASIEQRSPKYQQDLAAAQFKLAQEKKTAGEGLPVKDVIEILRPEYETKITGAMNAAEAIKEARRYAPDMFSGRLAEFNLQAAKTALALSPAGTFPELEKRVQATEKYRAIANQLAGALRPIIAGNNQQSNAELDRILESAAVGASTEANTRLEILNNIGRSNFLNIHRFQERAAGLAGGDENRQRDILRALPTRMETQIPESTITKLQRNYRENPTQQTLDEFNQTFFTPGLAQQLLKTHGTGQ